MILHHFVKTWNFVFVHITPFIFVPFSTTITRTRTTMCTRIKLHGEHILAVPLITKFSRARAMVTLVDSDQYIFDSNIQNQQMLLFRGGRSSFSCVVGSSGSGSVVGTSDSMHTTTASRCSSRHCRRQCRIHHIFSTLLLYYFFNCRDIRTTLFFSLFDFKKRGKIMLDSIHIKEG